MKNKLYILLFVATLAFSSCENWLNVSENTRIPSGKQFSDQKGFIDATIGVYLKMTSTSLYAKAMSWHFVEYLSQQYAVVSGSPDLDIPKYVYEGSKVQPYQQSIWLAAYNVIANINNILNNIDAKKEMLHPVIYNTIKGEMLALRAYIHFDLMRLYGYGDLANRPEIMKRYAIPYKRVYSKEITHQLTYAETLKLLNKDIADAAELLKIDRVTGNYPKEFYGEFYNDPFLNGRRFRMNYFAVKALQARVALWQGTPEMKALAIEAAEEVIEGENYQWTTLTKMTNPDEKQRDLIFFGEHLFTLNIEKFNDEIIGPWLDPEKSQYSVVYLTATRFNDIYESASGIGDSDLRRQYCFNGIENPQGTKMLRYEMLKYKPVEDGSYNDRIPMLKLSEIYYIAAECYATGQTQNMEKAVEYLNTVREHRGIVIPLETNLSLDQFKSELTKEYLKEFIGEGQLFFYYKRLGMKKIMGYPDEMTDLQYRFPYPLDEKTNSGIID